MDVNDRTVSEKPEPLDDLKDDNRELSKVVIVQKPDPAQANPVREAK